MRTASIFISAFGAASSVPPVCTNLPLGSCDVAVICLLSVFVRRRSVFPFRTVAISKNLPNRDFPFYGYPTAGARQEGAGFFQTVSASRNILPIPRLQQYMAAAIVAT